MSRSINGSSSNEKENFKEDNSVSNIRRFDSSYFKYFYDFVSAK